MKKLACGLFGTALLAMAGCTVSGGGDSLVDVQWLDNVNAGECPPGSTARVTSVDVDFGDTFVELFNCEDGGGSYFVPPGDYDITVDVFDDLSAADPSGANDFFYGTSGTLLVDAFGDVLVDLPVVFEYGYLTASWTIDGLTPDATLCDDPAGDFSQPAIGGVSILSTLVGSGGLAVDDIFNCEAGGGTTDELELGSYDVVVTFLDDTDAEITSSGVLQADLINHQEVVDLQVFDYIP